MDYWECLPAMLLRCGYEIPQQSFTTAGNILSVFGSDSKVTDSVSGLYMASEGRCAEINTREEDRTGSEFCPEGHT